MRARRVSAPLLFALCPLPFALRSLPFALRPSPFARCFSSRSSSLLQLLECTRPVCFQETGEGAVSQESPASLTSRTVVGLVRRIDNPLDRCTTLRTGFA